MSERIGVSDATLVGLPLTEHEYVVLRHAADGLTMTGTAREIGRTADTVRKHRQRMMDKLGAANIVNAVHIAHQKGML